MDVLLDVVVVLVCVRWPPTTATERDECSAGGGVAPGRRFLVERTGRGHGGRLAVRLPVERVGADGGAVGGGRVFGRRVELARRAGVQTTVAGETSV